MFFDFHFSKQFTLFYSINTANCAFINCPENSLAPFNISSRMHIRQGSRVELTLYLYSNYSKNKEDI